MEEIWKTVDGYEGYQISSLGRLRKEKNGRFYYLKQSKRWSQHKEKSGCYYMEYALYKNGKRKTFAVHRLVATAFIPNDNNYPVVNHKNGIKDDNRVDNLEWCTHKQNSIHAYCVLNVTKNYGEIIQYTKDGLLVKEYNCPSAAAFELKISVGNIIRCAKKQRAVAGGYIWRFKDDNENVEYINNRDKSIVMLNKYGDFVMTFDNIVSAAKYVNKSESNISSCCLGKTISAGGYIWRFESEYDKNEFSLFNDKRIVQKTIHNVFVKEYFGIKELIKDTDYNIIKIIRVLTGQNPTAYRSKWELVD